MTSIREIFTTFDLSIFNAMAIGCPRPIAKSSMLSSLVAPRLAIAFYNCQGCAHRNSSSFPAAIATVPPASTTKLNSGSNADRRQLRSPLPDHVYGPRAAAFFHAPKPTRLLLRSIQASSEAIKKLALDQKHIGGSPSFFGVRAHLTNSSVPSPHSLRRFGWRYPFADRSCILPESISFSPSKLSLIFQAKFRDLMKQAPRFDQIPPMPGRSPGTSTANRLAPPSYSQISRPLRLQSRHLQLAHRCRPDRTVQIRYRKPHSERRES